MPQRVHAIFEKASDGYFSCFVKERFPHFGLAGFGESVQEAKADLYECYREMNELEQEAGRGPIELAFSFAYDIGSFFAQHPTSTLPK